MHILMSTAADVEMVLPAKKDACGTTTLVRLKSIGSSSPVSFNPPVLVNCQMVSALYHWQKTALQPASRSILRSSVNRIIGASGYACRNVYNRPQGNLSQHAFGNAIDISVFELRDGRMITVRKNWGPNRRDIKQRQQEPVVRIRAAFHSADIGKNLAGGNSPSISRLGRAGGGAALASSKVSEGHAPPLPRLRAGNAVALARAISAARFLKRLHSGACGPFYTVLGPEENEAHRGHFHFDLNATRDHPYCN